MKVLSLHVYPVKSTAPTDLAEAVVEPWGIAGDRRWIVVDPAGQQVTAREEHDLLAVHVSLTADGIVARRPGADPLVVRTADLGGPLVTAVVWRQPIPVTDAGDDAAAWFSAALGRPVRLAWLDDPTRRPVPDGVDATERVSLADGFPLLVATTGSLRQLNDWVAEAAVERGEDMPAPLPMRRFRPNVVVDADEPFVEDGWARVTIGAMTFRSAGPCARCVMTTVDLATLRTGKEPLRTLARHRRWDGNTWFALNLVPAGPGTIRVGDGVTAQAAGG